MKTNKTISWGEIDSYFSPIKFNDMKLHNDMWQNRGTWINFGNDLWNNNSSRWSNGNWNNFNDLDSFFKEVDKNINVAFNEVTKELKVHLDIAKEQTPIKKFKIRSTGIIVFSYKYNKDECFKKRWDNIVSALNKISDQNDLRFVITTDDAEFDRSTNKITGIIKYKLSEIPAKYIVSVNYHDVITRYLINVLNDVVNNHNITIESITRGNDNIFDYTVNNFLYYINSNNQEIVKSVTEHPVVEQTIIKDNVEEINKPKWLKVLDESKKRFRKRTFEIVKRIDTIDDIPVNCFIVRQIRGDKDRKKYTLNQNDCELLGIEYRDGLEVMPGDLEYENVYKKIKNE